MQKKILYPAKILHRKLPVNYNDMHESKTTFIIPDETIEASYLFEIKNVYVSPFGIVYNNGLVMKESVYSMFKPYKQQLSFFKKLLANNIKHINSDCIVAHNAYYENYFHWLLEIMPRLFAYKDDAKNLTLIITDFKLPNFAKEFIDLFGFKGIIFLKENELAKVERLVFATHLSRGLAFNPIIIKEMKSWLHEKLFDNSYINAPERIFISRKNTAFRKTINENEIEEFLHSKGFVTYDLEKPTIREQANFFKNAKYIIGSHGAGFSNMLYSNQCKLIIDIISEKHPQDCFYNLANVFDTDYYYFQCKGTGANSYANNDDIVVDIVKFKQTVERFITN